MKWGIGSSGTGSHESRRQRRRWEGAWMHFIFTSSDAKMDFRMCCADVQRGERGSQPITIRWFTKCGLVTLATIYGTALDYRLINIVEELLLDLDIRFCICNHRRRRCSAGIVICNNRTSAVQCSDWLRWGHFLFHFKVQLHWVTSCSFWYQVSCVVVNGTDMTLWYDAL